MKYFLCYLIISGFTVGTVFTDNKNDALKIQKEIDKIDLKIEEIKKNKNSVLNQIYKVELRYEKELLKKNKLRFEIRDLTKQIKVKISEEKNLSERINKSREKIKKILRVLYKQGSNKHIRVFLNTKNIDRLFKNYKFFESLISFNNKEIVNFRADIKKLLIIKEDLSLKNKQKQISKTEIEKKISNLRRIKKNKLILIKKINNDKEKYTKLKYELEQEFLKFNKEISTKTSESIHISDSEINKLKGKFIWPVKGKLITKFGKHKSTKFNTYVINTGIEIKPINNQNKIKSIYAGNIVFAGNWKGYGKLIAVQHSKNFISFYGHCEKFLKQKGAIVKKGESIAIVGDTGSANTKSLYFEIRKDLIAKDPIKWLKKI